MTGAAIGAVGGPVGAAIGGVAGALAGGTGGAVADTAGKEVQDHATGMTGSTGHDYTAPSSVTGSSTAMDDPAKLGMLPTRRVVAIVQAARVRPRATIPPVNRC